MEKVNTMQLTPAGAEVISVIAVTAFIGNDTPDDPYRVLYQYWSLDGRLLAEYDTGKTEPDLYKDLPPGDPDPCEPPKVDKHR